MRFITPRPLFWLLLLIGIALTSRDLQAATSPLVVINEIMYHAPSGSDADQWIELYNAGTASASVGGWRFTKGPTFVFPAGTRVPVGGLLVVAANPVTFSQKYPGVTVVGGWSGRIGHSLELSDALGKVVNAVDFASDGDWATRVMGAVQYNHQGWEWSAIHDGGGASLELINPLLPNTYAHNWAANNKTNATPGLVNSVASADAAPFIATVANWPPVPKPGQQVAVTARLVDEQMAGLSATLNWRVDGTPEFTSTPMTDDGTHQDGGPGDGVYGAIVPGQSKGTIVEFFITATDGAGHSRQYPQFVQPTNSTRTANLLFQVDDGVYTGTQPVYRIVMREIERAELYALGRGCPDSDSDATMNATWITQDGVLTGGTGTEVRYNVGVRNRGHGSRKSNPNNYHVEIPTDRTWKKQKGINLNSQYAFAQVLGSAVFRKAGLGMTDSRPVQVRVNSTNIMSLSLPDNNSFGSYAANEQYNSDFIQRTFPRDSDGNSYRGIRDSVLCDPTFNGVADLTWHGTNFNVAAYTNAYFKQNNIDQNDASDLIGLIGVLNVTNGTTTGSYVQDVQRVLNVEEWMTYMAANTLMDNAETALANGIGDDYALYRGVLDPRFLALPYDLDAVMGNGLTSTSPRDGIFRMTVLSSMDRFMKTPEFAPVYYRKLKQMAESIFTGAEMNPLIDQLLGNFVSAGALANLKAFNASHVAYVVSQIPLTLTATSTLSAVSGYYHTTLPNVNLNGSANAIDTRRVLVNGSEAAWVAWNGTWSLANMALLPGINRLTVTALGTNDMEIGRTFLDVWYEKASNTPEGGTVSGTLTWPAVGGPYIVNSSLTIAPGATLQIQAGTTVYLASGVNITVADGGRLLAEGTAVAPIRFTRAPGTATTWGGIVVNGSVNSPETRISFAHLEFNGTTVIHSAGGTLFLDHLTFGTTDHQYLSLDSSSFTVSDCLFPTPSAAFEPAHGNGGIKSGGHGLFLRNYFGKPNGFNDVVDFTGGNRPDGPVVQFIDNVFMGSDDDILDLDGTDAWIQGNIFMHSHRNGSPDSSSAVSGGSFDFGTGAGGVQTSEITIIGNYFFDCDNVATAKEGNFFTLLNNTMVHITKTGGVDGASGVVNVRDTTPDITPYGKGYYLENNVITDVEQLVRNYDSSQVQVTLNNNLLPIAWSGPGTNNVVANPFLTHIPTNNETLFANWSEAQILREWFKPQNGSPALQSGSEGQDKGAYLPMGVVLTGQPTGTNVLGSATIRVGYLRTGSGIPSAGFPQGSGYTHYKWRLDGGAWSAETAISTPIVLAGLSNGPHRVEVTGKNDAGYYQDDVLLGVDGRVSSTATWVVDGNAPSPVVSVRLNEILASNTTTVTNDTGSPDLLELFNYGTTDLDLGGLGLSTDVTRPFAFSFPSGTRLSAGQYLVVYADLPSITPGIHLGFSLKRSGDSLFLTGTNGQTLDSVTFGIQIPNYSLGRKSDGSWKLCLPTFGSSNVEQTLGSPSFLRLNEWLADVQFSAPYSFLEIYNPEDRPVELTGLHLSNTAGDPGLHQIPGLSFIAPKGFSAFVADKNPSAGADHLNFKLAADVGVITLGDTNLQMIDNIAYASQRTDVSEGRSPNGSDLFTTFNQPTPGASNPSGAVGGYTTNIISNTSAILPFTATWKYNQAGIDLGTAWRVPGYDDTSWSSGGALFYHGTAPTKMPIPVVTTLNFTSPQQKTFYFRTHFNYTGSLSGATLNLTHIIDDGVVVYLNNTAIWTNNMPVGAISYSTLASATISDATQGGPVNVIATGLVSGDNLLAVEVHQSSITSSDIAMALAVDAVVNQTNVVANGAQSPAVVLNEILASNSSITNLDGHVTDWIELYNPTSAALDLAGVGVTDDISRPTKFLFPTNVLIPPNGFLLVECDGLSAVSPTNTGFNLGQKGGTIFIFDAISRGGTLLDSVRYGFQVRDYSISRIPNGTGVWQLSRPTPAAVNAAAATGDSTKVRINEWMASPSAGSDWFELYNGDTLPVNIGGLYLTDDLADRSFFRIQPLSFIGTGSGAYVRFEADDTPANGPGHVNFKLSSKNDEIGLYPAEGTAIDTVSFGQQQNDISQGRLPDGATNIVSFPGTSSPEGPNFITPPGGTDSDGDGIPDDWEIQHGLDRFNAADAGLDFDGDGMTNLQEYLAGTDPQDPSSNFKLLTSFSNNVLVISFKALAGHSYTVQSRDAFGTSTWVSFQQIPTAAQSAYTTVSINLPPTGFKFYRVVTPSIP